jgi:hypothetical protein
MKARTYDEPNHQSVRHSPNTLVVLSIGALTFLSLLVIVLRIENKGFSGDPASTSRVELPASALITDENCTLVELRPGYPGYRGIVAGLIGPSEAACLEQLQREFPWFDRGYEDAENEAAARRLELTGGPEIWVWENWLAIESERGVPVTCYMCARELISAGVRYLAVPADRNDVRLQVGSFDSSELLFRVAARNDMETWEINFLATTDYELRARAWTGSPGRQLNAIELLSSYDKIAKAFMGQSGNFEPYAQPLWVAIDQGGYAPSTADTSFDDQVFLLSTALNAQAIGMNPGIVDAMRMRFDAVMRTWASERMKGDNTSLAEYLQEINWLS